MFRIGEFSKLSQVSIRMLRYYDHAGLLKPAMIDPVTGYRMYSAGQISEIQKINLLRGMGFSIAETADAMENWSESYITRQLEVRRNSIERDIALQQGLISQIDSAIADIGQGKFNTTYSVTMKRIPEYVILSLRRVIPDYFAEGTLWQELAAYARSERLMPHILGNFAIYHDRDYRDHDVDVETALILDNPLKTKDGFICRRVEGVESMMCVIVLGPYENIGPAYRSFALWLEEHPQYRVSGLCRQICHVGPDTVDSPSEYVTELQIPVKSKIYA